MSYDDGRDLMLDLVRRGRPGDDERWLRLWSLAEHVGAMTDTDARVVVAEWRRHAEIMLEFGDELEVDSNG